MSSKVWSIGFSKHEQIIEYHVHIRSTDHFKQIGVRETKNTEMTSKVWKIDTNFVVFKKTNIRINLKTYVFSSLEYWFTETYKNDWE